MADDRDLERVVKIAAPYDQSVEAEVLVESLPVWFDLGWQKVAGEDYGLYEDLEPAAAESSPSYEYAKSAETNRSQVLPRTALSQGSEPGQR